MRAMAVWVALASLLVPGSLSGQSPDLVARLDPQLLESVRPILEAARQDSLPVATLESKILEGVAKGVPAPRIREVSFRLADELRSARALLRASMPTVPLAGGEISAAAMAIRHGVPADRLVELWQTEPGGRSLEIPVVVVAELVRRGISADASIALMTHAMEAGTPMNRAAQIPAKLDLMLPSAGAPQAALLEALRSLGIPIPPWAGRRPGG